MSNHEIPFTRDDFLLQLAGRDATDVKNLFDAAVEGQRKGYELRNGEMGHIAQIYELMRSGSSRFIIPDYFFNAWADACRSESGDLVIPTYSGVRMVSWDREFIVAEIVAPDEEKAD